MIFRTTRAWRANAASDDATQSTVDLATHRGESGLDDLDLGDDEQPAAA